MSDLFEPMRNYCERTGDLLWSEPLNAFSNIAFFIAAWMLWKSYKANHIRSRPTAILIALIALVGLGSTLFHTFANGLTMLGDVIPIAIFTFYYLWNALRRLVGFSQKKTTACLFLFAAIASQTSKAPPEFRFNGSIDYFPCLFALLLISLGLLKSGHPAAKRIFLAAALFITSLTFRSVDFALCAQFPIGTHFMWHMTNGLMLYLLASVFTHKYAPTKEPIH